MKSIATAFGAILVAVSLSSCYAPHTKQGAVVGGLIGAGTGAIIGNQSCRPLEGAAIGGAIGALGGGLIGSAQDDRAARYHNRGGGYGYSGGGYDKGGYDKGGYGYRQAPPPPRRNYGYRY